MKVVIGYPPLDSKKGIPLLSQNRQFQWFKVPTFIYPIIPAYAATLINQANHQVVWLDGIAGKWTFEKWLIELKKLKPDLLMMEAKTPVIKHHWKIINKLKRLFTNHLSLITVLVGDHVTALPEESFKNSQVDYILTGGDYDFLLLNLVNHLTKGEKLKPGILYKKKIRNSKFEIRNTGKFKLNHDLDKLPVIDRELTKWQLYAYKNGNYKKTPGTYIMAARDCWWHRCSFCSWTSLYPNYRVRKVENVLKEIGQLIKKYKIREIMDDSGTFPAGNWLRNFCQGMINRGYHKKIYFDCNLRFGALTKKDYKLMAQAGFRLLLYGLESANQKTIDKLNKGIKINEVEKELRIAKEANKEVVGHLEPHLTCMVGYPWEKEKDAKKTVQLTKELFKKGLIASLQASLIIPYPGTKLFTDCQKKSLLKTKNWRRFDMKEPVIKSPISNKKLLSLTRNLYQSALSPQFVLQKVTSIRSWEDIRFLSKIGIKFLGHLWNFKYPRHS